MSNKHTYFDIGTLMEREAYKASIAYKVSLRQTETNGAAQ